MESTDKLTDTNAILAYLYENFPLCFIAEGEIKPLKIGLFQDLAERLADDSKVSKTQLRVALRRYTGSWRYLKCIKTSMQRVDLDGKSCGELAQEHIDHAQATLKESQDKAKAKRVAQATLIAPSATRNSVKKTPKKAAVSQDPKIERPAKPTPKLAAPVVVKVPVVKLVQAQLTDLTKKQRVNVKLGMTPVAGVITDINKEDIHVQLDSGLTIKVRAEHILL